MIRLAPALPRAWHLLDAASLASLLREGCELVLLEVGCGPDADLHHGHIPGARLLDIATLEEAPFFNKVSDKVLVERLARLGVRHDSMVVLYGRHNSLAAARAAHLMLYAGVSGVRLLDGGLAEWRRAGMPCAHIAAPVPEPSGDFGAAYPARPDLLCSSTDVRRHLRTGDATLASIRTRNEYLGRTSGYCYIDARGEIPGARWGQAGCEGDIHSMSSYQLADGCTRPAQEIAAMWAQSGIGPQRPTIFYCGTGWRASLAFFYAYLMGWDSISVYDGGWLEWSSDPANPVVCFDDFPTPVTCASATSTAK